MIDAEICFAEIAEIDAEMQSESHQGCVFAYVKVANCDAMTAPQI